MNDLTDQVLSEDGVVHRERWVAVLERIARPVLSNMAIGRLRNCMPYEHRSGTHVSASTDALQAFGRTLCGIAPWLELEGLSGAEANLQAEYRCWARKAIGHALDPESNDYLSFDSARDRQNIVDTAFLAQAILRAPKQLWKKLPPATQQALVDQIQTSRRGRPPRNNWLLFSAIIEAFFHLAGEPYDVVRIDYALSQFDGSWYLGDGIYGDGPNFHWDYYNSYVIHPMLMDLREVMAGQPGWQDSRKRIVHRAKRWAMVQERLISPEATFPLLGRSITYRFGALQGLAQMALLEELPDSVEPAAVRSALTAVFHRMLSAPGTFDEAGWLRIGFCGAQPGLGESYISTGSLYLCAAGLLPLGLSPGSEFWSAPSAAWTNLRAWNHQEIPCDHAW